MNLEEDNVGAALLRRVGARQGGRARPPHRPRRERAGRRRRCSAASSTRSAARSTARAPIETAETPPARVQGAGRRRAPAGEGAAADRDQGDRLDDERRPRPARADHRRPRHRQDRDRDRHDPEPARPGRDLHLRRDRPEGLDGRAGVRAAQGRGRDGLHDHRHRAAPTRPRRSSGWRRSRAAAMGEYFMYEGKHALVHLRRPLQARGRLPAALAPAAPPAGPRGVPGRRLLPALAAARARRASSRTRTAAAR